MISPSPSATPPSPHERQGCGGGWRLRCPACGKGGLYDGLVRVRKHCEVCGMGLAEHDSADGPAFIVMLLLNFLILGLAVWVEFRFEPPMWVHLLLWIPLILLLSVIGLRYAKSLMIAAQYRHHIRGYGDAAHHADGADGLGGDETGK